MDGEPLRIGILGAARITVDALADPAKETGDRLVLVAARDGERARRFAAEHGVDRVARDYPEVIADPEVEILYNPLANAARPVERGRRAGRQARAEREAVRRERRRGPRGGRRGSNGRGERAGGLPLRAPPADAPAARGAGGRGDR